MAHITCFYKIASIVIRYITDFEVGQDQIEIQCVNRLGFNDLHITRGPNSNSVMIEFSGNQIMLTGITSMNHGQEILYLRANVLFRSD